MKIKISFILLLISFQSFLLFGVEGPKIVFKEITHDMGKIPYTGKPVIYGFRFKNLGTTPLIIKNVRTDCSCLNATFPQEPIPPGESGEITVKYNPGGFTGVFYKSYKVSSNDETQPNIALMLQGDLKIVRTPSTN